MRTILIAPHRNDLTYLLLLTFHPAPVAGILSFFSDSDISD